MNQSAERHLVNARDYVARGEDFYRKAAAEIVAAQEADPTLSQREIGEWFGRGKTWVGDIVRWHTSGQHAPPTPYSRDVAKVENTTAKRVLRDSTPKQVEEIVASLPREAVERVARAVTKAPEARVAVTKALDEHYTERAETRKTRSRAKDVERKGGEDEFERHQHEQRLAEVVDVVRGATSGLRFAASQVREIELSEKDSAVSEELLVLLDEASGFISMLTACLRGEAVDDEALAALIGDRP